jgi:excisionase family DNA binding protein
MRTTTARRPVVASEPAPNRLALTVPEAAWLLHCSPNTVWGLIHNGRLDSFRVGRRRMVARPVIERFIGEGVLTCDLVGGTPKVELVVFLHQSNYRNPH